MRLVDATLPHFDAQRLGLCHGVVLEGARRARTAFEMHTDLPANLHVINVRDARYAVRPVQVANGSDAIIGILISEGSRVKKDGQRKQSACQPNKADYRPSGTTRHPRTQGPHDGHVPRPRSRETRKEPENSYTRRTGIVIDDGEDG